MPPLSEYLKRFFGYSDVCDAAIKEIPKKVPAPSPPEPELSCIAARVIEDLKKYPISEWVMDKNNNRYDVYKHHTIKYSIRYDGSWGYATVEGLDILLSSHDTHRIGDVIWKQKLDFQRKTAEEMAKDLFPECHEA